MKSVIDDWYKYRLLTWNSRISLSFASPSALRVMKEITISMQFTCIFNNQSLTAHANESGTWSPFQGSWTKNKLVFSKNWHDRKAKKN